MLSKNFEQSLELHENDGNNEGADDSLDLDFLLDIDVSQFNESQCQQIDELIAYLEADDIPSPGDPPGDDTTHEEPNQLAIEEEQNMVYTEERVEVINPEPQQPFIILVPVPVPVYQFHVTSPANCPINNQIPMEEEEPTPGPSTSAQKQLENVGITPKIGRPSNEDKGLTKEEIIAKRTIENRESQRWSRLWKLIATVASIPTTLPPNLSPEPRSRIINEGVLHNLET